MKRCPECRRDYFDDTLAFCLEDGTALAQGSVPSPDEPPTAFLHETAAPAEAATRAQIHTTEKTAVLPPGVSDVPRGKGFDRRLLFVPFAAALIVLGGFIAYRYFTPTKQIESIAVLPFENRSGNADSDYLSDGLAESLIYRLTQMPQLRVSPTSSVLRLKSKDADLREIASQLGVQAVLTGRMTQRGDNLTISVELFDAVANRLLWGEQYERKMADLLTTQREIAATIADKLQLKLSGEDAKDIAKKYTDSSEAYQHYLKGRHYWNKRSKESIEQGIVHFQKAIDLDPKFALAHVGIADSYFVMPSYAYIAPKEGMPKAIAAAKRALEIDPELAEAHSTYGSALTYEFRWAEAEAEIKRSIELDPNSAEIHYRYALEYLAPVGRLDDAIRAIDRALELEPLSMPISANLAGLYLNSRRNDEALEQALKVYALEPGHATASYWLGWAYVANGRYSEAIELCKKLLPTDPENQDILQILGYAQAKAGRPDEAKLIISKFAEMSTRKYVVSYRIATLYAVLGEKDQAFALLEKSLEERDWDVTRLYIDPFVEPLRHDPRFAKLVDRLKLPN